MKVITTYSIKQLDATVDFLSKHNKYFKGRKEYIRQSILENIKLLASDVNVNSSGTMGYYLEADRDYEDMDTDDYACFVSIHVDLCVSNDPFDEESLVEQDVEIMRGPRNK